MAEPRDTFGRMRVRWLVVLLGITACASRSASSPLPPRQVDLHTPQFVTRPDASGDLVQPAAVGVVAAERGSPGDADADRIPDDRDLCPQEPEDYDGFEDEDGCPDLDNDQDRILDANDKCPNEPETYNGFEDDDGCPDKGRVIVRKCKIEVLDKIYFPNGKGKLDPISSPLLDAIATTLLGNPQIVRMEVGGHAAATEPGASGLAGARAAAVRHALVLRKVPAARLVTQSYGSTRPICAQKNEDCWSKNRRVEFVILSRRDEVEAAEEAASPAPAPSPASDAARRRGGQRRGSASEPGSSAAQSHRSQ
jgi:outer membrane protein OmpA-like peptidoglycan-associated protein